MAFDLDALLDLWATPFPDSDEEAADRIRSVWMCADELGTLVSLGAVRWS
jgi:hypothetical protein